MLGRDDLDPFAEAFLNEYWRKRIAEEASSDTLVEGLAQTYGRMVRVYPVERITFDALRERLVGALGDARVVVAEDGSNNARLELRGVTPASVAADFDALREQLGELGTHAILTEVDRDASTTSEYREPPAPALRLHFSIPLVNWLFIGDVPPAPLSATEYGRVSPDSERLLVAFVGCPSCRAEHAVFYHAKAHAQDSEDRDFACLACARCVCTAYGIPELSPYRIDLVDRLTGALATRARKARQARNAPPPTYSPRARPNLVLNGVVGLVLGLVVVFVVNRC